MIHADLATCGYILRRTLELQPESLPELVPLFARGFVYAQRDMTLWCLDNEPEWPWNRPDGEPVSCQ